MTDEKQYQGSCHCGRVRYQVKMALGKVVDCNCSICRKRGSLLSFVPAEKFRLLAGEGELTDYQFNKHIIHHTFCKTCGILPFAKGKSKDGSETRAINVRCLDDVDPDSLEKLKYDGRSM